MTGLRIGQALGRGLSKSLNCEYREISVLESLLIKRNKDGIIVTAVKFNDVEVWYEIFRAENNVISQISDKAVRCRLETFKDLLVHTPYNNYIYHGLSNKNASDNLSCFQLFTVAEYIDLKENLSTYLGLYLTG